MKANIPKEEEELIVDYIYTTYLINLLEQDQQASQYMKFKIPEVYQHFIEEKLRILRKQLVAIKTQMRELNIKVMDPVPDNVEFVQYDFFAHGYTGHMRFWNAAMEFEGTRRLRELFMLKK